MTYTPVKFGTFRGLDVHDDPEEVGGEGATDLLNVDLDRLGRVRTRDGLVQYDTAGGASTAYDRIVADYTGSAPRMLLTTNTGLALRLDKITSTATAISTVGSWGANSTALTSYAAVGTPTSTLLFMATSDQTLRKYDGSSLSASVGKPAYVAVTPTDNRLAQAWFSVAADSPTGANGSTSTVFFSDPGAPETFSANNYLHLRPGDGEWITGMATFGDLLIVAKQSNLYVFFSTSTAGDGNPIFNYRRVSIPARMSNIPLNLPGYNGLVVGDDGIYFLTNRGLFVTTGGPPVMVSSAMTPIFDGTADSSLAWDGTSIMRLEATKQRIFIVYTTVDGTQRVLVWDARRQFWTVWSFPNTVTSISPYGTSGRAREDTFVTVSGGAGHVYKLPSGQTTDYGNAISAYWKSGLYEFGPPGADAFTRYTRLIGTGSPTLSVLTDYGTTDANSAAVTLGVTTPAEGYHKQSYAGRLFQHKLSSTSGAWTVSRVQHDVDWVRP